MVCTILGFSIDERKSGLKLFLHALANVIHGKSQVVYAFALVLQKFTNGAVFPGGAQQFYLGVAHIEKNRGYAFAFHRLGFVGCCSQKLGKKGNGCFKVFYGYANMLQVIHTAK